MKKFIFIRFIIAGLLGVLVGYYFIRYLVNNYTGWIFFIGGILNFVASIIYYLYHKKKGNTV